MLVMGASFLLFSESMRPVAREPAVSFLLPAKESSPRPEYILSISADWPEDTALAGTNWSGLANPSDMLICNADLKNKCFWLDHVPLYLVAYKIANNSVP